MVAALEAVEESRDGDGDEARPPEPEPEDDSKRRAEYEAAKDEWDQVQTVEVSVARPKAFKAAADNDDDDDADVDPEAKRPLPSSPLLTFDELWLYVLGTGVHGVPDGWHSESNVRSGGGGCGGGGGGGGSFRVGDICFPCAWMRKLWPPPSLDEKLRGEKDTVCALAACPFENDNEFHVRALRTIYRRLVGGGAASVDPPRFGPHWEDVGFQGSDPATDLRGVGFLSLVNAVYLVASDDDRDRDRDSSSDPLTPPTPGRLLLRLARDVHRLSTDARQNFPFMVLCINVTRIALLALKEGQLNQLCNEKGSVIGAVNEFYAAVLFHIYWRWKTEGRTIADSSPILQEAESLCRARPAAVIKRLKNHLNHAN